MAERKKKKRLSEIAYEEIKESIINNIYRQGTMLSEKQLCLALNMSRTPIREAIQMLVTENLLEVRDGVGTFVKERSQKDIEDAYELRRVLEILAAQTAVEHFTAEELDGLQQMFEELQGRLHNHATLSVEEYAETDWQLHDMIVQKSENSYVRVVMDEVRSTLKHYQGMSVRMIANAETSMREHLEIVEAIRRKDRERLMALLDQHIRY